MWMGHQVTQPLQSLSEMSATKDGIQRGLSRNKGQVLVWDEGWGWAGQMFTWNGLSGHPQATGAAGAWHGACLPTTMGHCKDSDPSQMGTHPKAPEGLPAKALAWSLPPRPCPLLGREGAGLAESLVLEAPASLASCGLPCVAGQVVHLPRKQVGLNARLWAGNCSRQRALF